MHIARRRVAHFITVVSPFAAWLLSAVGVVADDWPQWRGPHRDGKVGGFKTPEKWPERLIQKWKVIVGVGDSTPALVGDKLYVFGRQGADEVIQCLDAASGKAVWESRYPAGHVVTGPPARHPGTRSSPAITETKICTLGVGGILSCLDAQTGKVLWRKQSADDYQGIPYKSDTSMSPLLQGGMCFVHVGGKTNGAIFAFELVNAQELKAALAQSPHQPAALVFQNRFGQPLTRWGVEKRLRRTVQLAALHCSSLKGRRGFASHLPPYHGHAPAPGRRRYHGHCPVVGP
jgi:hypothetical protein